MGLDPALLEGARNAVRVCMNVHEADRALIVTDDDTRLVGDVLLHETLATHAVAELVRLEEHGARPMLEMPAGLGERIVAFAPTVVFLAVSALDGELTMRGQFSKLAYRELKARHAHMPTITPAIMREGLRVDYRLVNRITTAVHEIVRRASEIRARSARGSDLVGRFSDRLKWVACHGLYHNPGEGGNLPEGEVYTCPESVDGVLVADVVGDYFAPKYGLLEDPVTIEIEKGYARHIRCANRALEKELLAYVSAGENGLRVGEFAIGTNVGVRSLRGSMLQDEKIPGLHLALGFPYAHLTGADWSSDTHVDFVPSTCTIEVDGTLLMEQGRFTRDFGEKAEGRTGA